MVDVQGFREKIFDFYEDHGRDLPWRETTDPYKILVSEVMLQQTQVSRVVPKYNEWLEHWPDVSSLADASLQDVMPVWSGLGYNNRAKRLRNAAVQVVNDFDTSFPKDVDVLQELPGVGPYTARALLIFAWNEDIVTVDTNIRRIFIHEFDLDPDVSMNTLYNVAQTLLPKGRSREWHNALMDYGALEATSYATGIRSESSQSDFEGSRRYCRGQILQRVTAEGSVSLDEFDFEDYDAEEVVKDLEDDGMVTVRDGCVLLAE